MYEYWRREVSFEQGQLLQSWTELATKFSTFAQCECAGVFLHYDLPEIAPDTERKRRYKH